MSPNPSESNRGASWIEIYRTSLLHSLGLHLAEIRPKDAFRSRASFLEARCGISPFKGGAGGFNVNSLGPFGLRHGLAGVSVAPKFLYMCLAALSAWDV